jgi:glycosyltransferase involved in cell wall biosynthesis
MKCRILYVVGQLGAGGSERQLYLLLKGMDRVRYRPEVVVWNFREDDIYVSRIRELGVLLHSLPDRSSGAKKIYALRRFVLERSPEVIHSYTFYTNFAVWLAALTTECISIGAMRSNFSSENKRCGWWLGCSSARWPRVQIYNNFAGAERAQNSRMLFVPKKTIVVRNGVDLDQFVGVPLANNGRVRIAGVGSLLQIKRWERLIQAAYALKKKGLDFFVEIIGEGPLHQSLDSQIQDLGLADRVRLLGYRDDVPQLLANCTLLAHTSEMEGCPNAVIEAMACGRPVVASTVGDIRWLVEDGRTGFLVDDGDHEKLVERLEMLIKSRDLCRKMGEAGRMKAEREFGVERLISETFEAYRAAGWQHS